MGRDLGKGHLGPLSDCKKASLAEVSSVWRTVAKDKIGETGGQGPNWVGPQRA